MVDSSSCGGSGSATDTSNLGSTTMATKAGRDATKVAYAGRDTTMANSAGRDTTNESQYPKVLVNFTLKQE